MKITTFFIALSLMLPCLEATGQEDFALQAQWFPVRQLLWETYPFLKPYSPIVAIVSNDKGKFNLVNERGERLCKQEYNYIQIISTTSGEINRRYFLASSAEAQYVLDDNGSILPLPDFQSCSYNASLNAFILKQGDHYGMVDTKGSIKLPFKYTSLHGDEHHIIASTDGIHFGTISSKGKTRIPPRFCKSMLPLPFGFISISNGETKAILDSSGRQLCDFQFHDIWPLPSGGYFASLPQSPDCFRRYNKDFHLIDDDLWLLSREQERYSMFCLPNKEHCLIYRFDGTLIYDRTGYDASRKINLNPYQASEETVAWAKKYSCILLKNGCYDNITGKRVLGPDRKVLFEYKGWIRYVVDGFFVNEQNGEEELLDLHGQRVIDLAYKSNFLKDGIILVTGPNGQGQMRPDGSFVLPAIYQNLEVVILNNTRHIRLKQKDLLGIADLEGNVLIAPAFNTLNFCRPNHWIAKSKDSSYVFDAKGQLVGQYGKHDCRSFIGQYIIVKKNGHWGIQDALGKEMIPFMYDYINDQGDLVTFSDSVKTMTRFWNGSGFQEVTQGYVTKAPMDLYPYVSISQKGKLGIYKRSGEVVLPVQYNEIIYGDKNIKAVRQGNICQILSASFKPIFTFQADSLLELLGPNLVFCIRGGQRYLLNPETGMARASDDAKGMIIRDVVWLYQGNSGLVLSLRTLREILPFEVETMSQGYCEQPYPNHIYLFSIEGKAGLIDTSGMVLVPFEMDKIFFRDRNNCFWLEKNGLLYGIYDISTHQLQILNVAIKEMLNDRGSVIGKNDLVGFMDKNLELTIPVIYETLEVQTNNTFLAKRESLFGVISQKNEILLPFEYASLKYTHENNTWVGKKPVDTNIIRADGKMYTIPNDYSVVQIKESWAIICRGKGYQGEPLGLFSFKTGKMMLPVQYQYIELYENGFAVIGQKIDNQTGTIYRGLLDSLAQWVIPLDSFQLVGFSKKAIAAIDHQGRYGLFDWTGHLILPFEWDNLIVMEDKPVIASKNGTYQMLRSDGVSLTHLPYDYIGYTWGEFYPVRRGKWWGYLDDQGEEALPMHYLFAGNFGNNGIASVLTDSGYQVISKIGYGFKMNGEDLQFPEIKIYREKEKPLCTNCLYDGSGRLITKINGVKLWSVVHGLLVFSTDTTASEPLKGVMDLSGKVLCPALYDEINLGNMLHAFRKGKLWGYMDSEGVARIAPQFDMAGSFNSDRLATVKKDGRHFYINRKGECEKNCP